MDLFSMSMTFPPPPHQKAETSLSVNYDGTKTKEYGASAEVSEVCDIEVLSQKTASIKALNAGHSTIKANLQRARLELSEKSERFRELEDDISFKKEQNWLLEERIRSMREKEIQMMRIVEDKEKTLDKLHKELAEAKWKLEEAYKFQQMVETHLAKAKTMQEAHIEGLVQVEESSDIDGETRKLKQLHEDVRRLKDFKIGLLNKDPKVCAIENGTKMLDLEERKRGIQDAFQERGARTEAMYLEIDELNENIKKKREFIEKLKKEHESKSWQLKNQLQCLLETEHRLQRSVTYMQKKVDYGMDIPVPDTWPNLKIT